MVYRYDSPLFFANAEDFRQPRARGGRVGRRRRCAWFVLNAEAIVEVDITGVDAWSQLRERPRGAGSSSALARVKQDLRTALAPSGLLERDR